MATLKDLKEKLGLTILTSGTDESRVVRDGYVCDLLSWVMARGKPDMAWITVQTHLNVIAVASLNDFSCIIIPESIEVPNATIAKAEEENIAIFSSDKTGYQICRQLTLLGVGE